MAYSLKLHEYPLAGTLFYHDNPDGSTEMIGTYAADSGHSDASIQAALHQNADVWEDVWRAHPEWREEYVAKLRELRPRLKLVE
jgi:hypothetical protein